VTAPANDPPPAPVVEKKQDPEPPPPSSITITKPPEPTPPEPPKFSEPTVTVVPAGVGSAASLGAPGSNGASAPATGVSAVRPPSEPRVQSYLEEEYRWQPGDSFAAICQKYYFAEKYSAALQEYNRDHPLAKSGMKQNPPAMSPGQAIWVPPVRILERDYANSIGDLRPLNDRGGTFVPTAKPAHSPNDTKHFKVRERGETMYEIARRTLGDSGQWFVVHRLNPTLSRDPKLPIPGGTVLQLPVEAKTEPADLP
jgi:nucleoid-associated protein YgaU